MNAVSRPLLNERSQPLDKPGRNGGSQLSPLRQRIFSPGLTDSLIVAGYWEFLGLLVPIGRPAFPIPAGINDWRLNSLNLHQGIPRSGSAKQKCVISEVNSTELGIVASDQNTPLDGLGLEQEGQGCFTDAMDAVRSLELSVTAADGCRSKTRSTGSSGLLLR